MKKINISTLYLWTAIIGLSFSFISYMIGIWFPATYGILVLGVLGFVVWSYEKRLIIKSFLIHKSTHRNGFHYSIIFLGLVIVLGFNFLADKYNKSFDITTDRINTLSGESLKIVKNLKKDVYLKVYYVDEGSSQVRVILKKLFYLYEKESSQIKSSFLNAKWDPSAAEYLTADNENKIVVYVENSKKKEKVSDPISEETITTAMIRLNSNAKYKVYFTSGHGEKATSDESPQGLSEFRNALLSRGLDTGNLSLQDLKNGEMPSDLFALIIAGPVKPFSETEKNILKAFIEDGGKILFALDPEFMSSFQDIFDVFGVQLKKDFVVSVKSLVPLFAMGSLFSKTSEITADFLNSQVMFPISGYISIDYKKAPKDVQVEPLVSTNEYAFTASTPEDVQKALQNISDKGEMKGQSFDLGVSIVGKPDVNLQSHSTHSHNEQFKVGKAFNLVVFADSDFLTNEHLLQFFNKDLALNSVVYLTGQKDLISIRPNQSKPTTIEITSVGLNIAALLSFSPFLIFAFLSAFFWFRKRSQ